ncbi:YHS domain-containing protein [Nocardiopsis arvandica]|uniref:YHS domain-containing protein n=1 Tax=Nocardiopsis sinuspersici TaxID=501010 RepID=A0A7Y9XFM4_9ACTN|nr:YHS domain protein [Nocardiopsis sinuspersici]NYH54896.1 YHS domain-containing protein [Nocardiopsis sinuspersici]
MMFIELFVPEGTLAPERLRRLAERLGTVAELTEGEKIYEGWEQVLGSLFQVVVHEPRVWVVDQHALGADAAPRYMVRFHVPGPWRKAMSGAVVAYATKVISEVEADSGRPYREPVVQVQVMGVTEGSMGVFGKAVDSEGIVEMMSDPYREDLARGRAARDPLCGVIVPLNDDTVTLEWEGTLHAFCCSDCREEFLRKQRKREEKAPA